MEAKRPKKYPKHNLVLRAFSLVWERALGTKLPQTQATQANNERSYYFFILFAKHDIYYYITTESEYARRDSRLSAVSSCCVTTVSTNPPPDLGGRGMDVAKRRRFDSLHVRA